MRRDGVVADAVEIRRQCRHALRRTIVRADDRDSAGQRDPIAAAVEAFHRRHNELYGHSNPARIGRARQPAYGPRSSSPARRAIRSPAGLPHRGGSARNRRAYFGDARGFRPYADLRPPAARSGTVHPGAGDHRAGRYHRGHSPAPAGTPARRRRACDRGTECSLMRSIRSRSRWWAIAWKRSRRRCRTRWCAAPTRTSSRKDTIARPRCSMPAGEVVAQATALPAQLGVLPTAVKRAVSLFGELVDGDVLALNDPYDGGTHLPDICLIAPIAARGSRRRLCGLHRASSGCRRQDARQPADRFDRHLSGRAAHSAGQALRGGQAQRGRTRLHRAQCAIAAHHASAISAHNSRRCMSAKTRLASVLSELGSGPFRAIWASCSIAPSA